MFCDYVKAQGDNRERAIIAAEHIDILTFNRIQDFNTLTETQQRIIKRVHNRLTQFEEDNEDLLDAPFNSYSINGVSMSFGENVKIVGGVVIPSNLYMTLCSTGLCYPAI